MLLYSSQCKYEDGLKRPLPVRHSYIHVRVGLLLCLEHTLGCICCY